MKFSETTFGTLGFRHPPFVEEYKKKYGHYPILKTRKHLSLPKRYRRYSGEKGRFKMQMVPPDSFIYVLGIEPGKKEPFNIIFDVSTLNLDHFADRSPTYLTDHLKRTDPNQELVIQPKMLNDPDCFAIVYPEGFIAEPRAETIAFPEPEEDDDGESLAEIFARRKREARFSL